MKPISVVSILNQKGGVGKTTTAINLSASLGHLGYKTLLVDADPQSNSTIALGIDPANLTNTFYSFLQGKSSMPDTVIKTEFAGLYIMPTYTDLYQADIELEQLDNINYAVILNKMKKHLTDYDFVVFDSPPHIGPLTINVMKASDTLLVPMKADFLALQGLAILGENLSKIQEKINPGITLKGIILTMYIGGTNLCKEVETNVREVMKDDVFQTIIPQNVALAEAPSHGKPVYYYAKKSNGSISYLSLTVEFLQRMQLSQREHG
ncbi:MAG: ParA family protein [Deltaproteobacteria bacterium]|jgi:chromosome partitioning protein|nr:ParA family protein [Deltaproteobacteria bacterium]